MDDDFDGLLDSALDEFHSVHEEEEGKRQQRQKQLEELDALQRQKQEQDRILQKLRELQSTTSTASSSSSSSSTAATASAAGTDAGASIGGAPAATPTPAVQPDDLLDAALEDYADGERQQEEARQQPKAGTPSGPMEWDDRSLHNALEMFTTALGTLVEGSDEPEFAKLAETLSALAKDVGSNAPAEDDDAQMAKVLESVESLRKLMGDDPELVKALDAATAELTETAPMEGGPPGAEAQTAAAAATGATGGGVPEQFDTRALTSMLSILGDALKQPGLPSDGKEEEVVDHDTFEKLVSKMMSPALFLPPFQRLRDLYPQWIEQHRDGLSTEDQERYTKQLEKVREICELCGQLQEDGAGAEQEVSDAAPEGSAAKRIWDCIEDMHQYGQPPAEILGAL
eukprot:GGOE01000864.1.p1 GENE.GGOE01000864.1~~GGOE01000864.1.p1  ORF type:complete len:416 (-),score=140.44 GGOE01000864.1:395-1594(-)